MIEETDVKNDDYEKNLRIAMDNSVPRKERFDAYNSYVDNITPKHSVVKNVIRAFVVGGIICTYGQAVTAVAQNMCGLNKEDSGTVCSIVLILTSVILTGLGIYKQLAKWGGAGALVPITGFANSISSPAVEFKVEGQVYGIGCKIFTIAGPVILYGLCTSFVLGLFYWIVKGF